MSDEPVDLACDECFAAAAGVHHGFRNGCPGCKARAASRSPHFRKARDTGMQTRGYRELLRQFELTHEQVKTAADNDAMGARA